VLLVCTFSFNFLINPVLPLPSPLLVHLLPDLLSFNIIPHNSLPHFQPLDSQPSLKRQLLPAVVPPPTLRAVGMPTLGLPSLRPLAPIPPLCICRSDLLRGSSRFLRSRTRSRSMAFQITPHVLHFTPVTTLWLHLSKAPDGSQGKICCIPSQLG